MRGAQSLATECGVLGCAAAPLTKRDGARRRTRRRRRLSYESRETTNEVGYNFKFLPMRIQVLTFFWLMAHCLSASRDGILFLTENYSFCSFP